MAQENTYLDELIGNASAKRLHEKKPWMVLLHYRPALGRGYESFVDDPAFFLSKEGKRDPGKELEGTLRGFFDAGLKDDAHPRCKFPARYGWLKEELGIKEELLPKVECKEYDELLKHIDPESAVLIFPVSHMNSPASMFGHTLLRIDSTAESKLLSYAVNYAAVTDETNGLFFAFKGIFGLYKGYFTILPYYEKIKEYSDLENRDMWEYRLNLSKEEVRKVVAHMWELKDIYSDYYFFDENCSYNLLLALEAARPGADLAESLPAWVIPMDTVRAVQERGMYSSDVSYRPSKATRIRFIEHGTEERYRSLADDIALRKADPAAVAGDERMDRQDRIKTLDLAAEYLQYIYSKKRIQKDDYLKGYLKVLAARSRLGKGAQYEIPAPAPPERGHRSSRLAFGAGAKKGASFQSLQIRPANHDLMDPDEGYLSGAAISFFDTELRYNYTESKLSLERLSFIEIISASGIEGFFRPVSWRVDTGLLREEFRKREHRTVLRLGAGPGVAVPLFSDGLAYAFVEPEARVGGGLEDGYAFGAGASAGLIKPVTRAWKAQLQASGVSFFLGDSHNIFSAELNQRFTLSRNNALKLGLKRENLDGYRSNEVNFSWNFYF